MSYSHGEAAFGVKLHLSPYAGKMLFRLNLKVLFSNYYWKCCRVGDYNEWKEQIWMSIDILWLRAYGHL